MRYIVTALLFALTLSAQTNIPLSALRADAPGERIMVYAPGIGVFFVQFDSAQVSIDRTTVPFTLRIAAPAIPPAPAEVRVNIKPTVGQTVVTYTLPERIKAGSLRVYRNGLLLTPADDYTESQSGTTPPVVQFVASQAISGPSAAGAQGDTAVVLYVKE